MMTVQDNTSFWLWLDARQGKKTTNWTAALVQGVAVFQTKDRSGDQRPKVVKAYPEQANREVKAAAQALGLQVVVDPKMPPGTFKLGLEAREEQRTSQRSKQLTLF
jgi:hypothetical protein